MSEIEPPPSPPNRYIGGWFGAADRANKRAEAQWERDMDEYREQRLRPFVDETQRLKEELQLREEENQMTVYINPPPTYPRPDIVPVPQKSVVQISVDNVLAKDMPGFMQGVEAAMEHLGGGHQPIGPGVIDLSNLPQGGTGQSGAPKSVEILKPGRILEL